MPNKLSRAPTGHVALVGWTVGVVGGALTIFSFLATAGPIVGGASLFALLLAFLALLVPPAARALHRVTGRIRLQSPVRRLPASPAMVDTSAAAGDSAEDVARVLSAEEVQIAQLHNTWAVYAIEEVGHVVPQIARAMRDRETSTSAPMQRIAERLLQEHYNAASRAMKEWASAIDSRVDLDALQRAAGEAYQSYQESIRTMREVIQALTFDVGDDVSNFNKWREFDAEYLAGLNTLCGHPELPTLKTLVTSHMWPAMGKRNFADWKPVQPGEPPGGTLDSAEVIDALIDYREALLEMINRVMLHDDVKAGLIAMSAKRTTQLDQSQRRSRKLVLARENVLRRMAAQANPATPTGSALSKVVAALGNLKAAPHWRDDREIEATAKIHQSIDGTVSAIHAAKAS